jgi:colicin import membrane protein
MTDPDPRPPAPEDPAALARRLAAEAKARLEVQPPPPDPRELARRLAEEAKARNAAQAVVKEDPVALAKRLAAEAKARVQATAPKAEPTPAPEPEPAAPKRSLSDRAKRPVSAMEALRLAAERDAEATAAAEAAEAAKVAEAAALAEAAQRQEATRLADAMRKLQAEAEAEAERRAQAERKAEADRQAATAPAGPALPQAHPEEVRLFGRPPQEVLQERLADVEVVGLTTVHDRAVFRALWRAHRARARAEGALELLVTADVLLDAAERVPAGALHALYIRSAGRPWAAWVDGDRQVVLGIAPTPDIYLAGL